ncbi:MAG: bifunctional diguanylate cyclase/phosphodiesterase [Alphaproteobacteria bacterium]|nr:bifunctional diguanylate cyclase/phosphodiesterase [Alphaproteobacteria bacterium]MDX5370420.1 bifunctional diguanylate cyclase/phosphodiesterase [Alphaproteobacteria bacterium]MDX5464928.1 bifunctional diguanylate cyclase/phosphodiesterase [Alphaproteobacteria bacterium]
MSDKAESPVASDVSTPAASDWLAAAMPRLGEAAYSWNLDTDEMAWTPGARELLDIGADAEIATGAGFLARMEETARATRPAQLAELRSSGASLELEYRFEASGNQPLWLEERLLWTPHPGGKGTVRGIVRNISDRKRREARLDYLASNDDLTGLLNRARLRERLAHVLAYALRFKAPCAFFIIAIDNLTRVNEAYGFDVADEMIVSICRRLESVLRAGDVLGRVGSAKFGVILPDCEGPDMGRAAERLLAVVRDEVFETRAGPVSATVSIGGVSLPGFARTTHDAISFAEEALDQAKHAGRDTFVPYQANFQVQSGRKRNISVANQILSALKEGRMQLAFQPIVDARTGERRFYECLARLMKADGTPIPAGEFIPVAEKLGLVRLIDRRVAELAIEMLHEMPGLTTTMNVSGMTAMDVNWLRRFIDLVRAHREVAPRLTVEITETIAIHDIEDSVRFVATLRDIGCGVAIDDFGAGYTSFRNLKAVPVDLVKIDGTFIRGIHQQPDNRVFVRALMDLARNFNVKVVGEMVGEPEEAKVLAGMGVDYLQGFLYGKPELGRPETPETLIMTPRNIAG